jgi:glycosyltransferase involved in cell wall biosynthesis
MISVLVTIHNKDFLVDKCLSAIIKNSTHTKEVIVVLDGCTDKSSDIARSVLENCNISTKFIVLQDVFETRANNAALRASTSQYSILVQDDMVVDEVGWDYRLVSPMLQYNDLFAVSAKNCHNNYLTGKEPGCGKDLIRHTDMSDGLTSARDKIYIRDTVNRGPLALDTKRVETLNFLDEVYSPYTWDDHDLCYRARERGWLCGSYSSKYISEKNWGTTRRKNFHIWKDANQRNQETFYRRHFDRLTVLNKEAFTRDVKQQ